MTRFYVSQIVVPFALLLSVTHLSNVRGGWSLTTPSSYEPWFAESVPNITVAVGRSAIISCVVENLGTYRLAWIHKDRHILLTLQNRVITRNPRVTIRTDPPRRTWWLRIDNVQQEDEGDYMCQVNTAPMISQTGYLRVVVAPAIDDLWTSSDLEIREGIDAHMKCRATGTPTPEIHWRREHDRNIILSPQERVLTVKGETLSLKKTSRLSMGAYLCIASNGVQPSVSKRIMLNVLFPPMILMPNQLNWASSGDDVSLICNLESNPKSITYWLQTEGTLLISNDKYQIHHRPDPSPRAFPYRIEMELVIRNLKGKDFGSYTCVAKNSLGETEGILSLYERPSAHTKAPKKEPFIEEQKQDTASTKNSNENLVQKSRVQHKNTEQLISSGVRATSADFKETFMSSNGRQSGSSTHLRPLIHLLQCCALLGIASYMKGIST